MAKPKTTTAPTGQVPPFGLRMLPDLKARIEDAARESGRSMNAEIVARLEASFSSVLTPEGEEVAKAVGHLSGALALKRWQIEWEEKQHAHDLDALSQGALSGARRKAVERDLEKFAARRERLVLELAQMTEQLHDLEERLRLLRGGEPLPFPTV